MSVNAPAAPHRSSHAGCWIMGCLAFFSAVMAVSGAVIVGAAFLLSPESPAPPQEVAVSRPGRPARAERSDVVIDGIPVHCHNDPAMFPAEWLLAPYEASAVELHPVERHRSQELVRNAMDAYPRALLKKYLTGVYMVDSMRIRGVPFGGTNSRTVLFLAEGGSSKGFSDRYVMGEFHHELAHILRRENLAQLDEAAWREANPEGFVYGGDAAQSLKEGHTSLRLDDRSLEKGFLGDYAMSTQEEDFTVTAEDLLTADEEFWKAVDSHPAIKKKVGITIEFYRKLDPSLTEEHFRGE